MNRPHLSRILLLLLATAVAAASAPAALLVRIPSGTERTVGSGVVSEATSSSPDIVTASPSPAGGITLHAGEPGRAEVTSRRVDGSVRVTPVLVLPALSENALAVYSLVGDIPGLEVYDAAGKIVIDGKVASASEKSRVDAVVAAFGSGVLNLSVLDTGKSNEAIADFILRSSGCETLSVSILGDTAYLRGTVPSDAARSNVLALASTQIAKIVDMTEVREDMIETEVLFLRVQKTSGWNFGMNLLDGGDGIGLQGSFNGSQAYADRHWGGLQMGVGWTATLAPRINAILSDGGGEVVARPRVGTRIGERGRFLSGGEMYYKTAGEVSGDLKSVEYGIELSVAPRYLSGDRLCNDITIELSFPNQQSSSADLSLDKYTIESSVVCELGQSVILSGLTERIRNSATDKTPVLGDIPVVNLFFSARSKELTESELIAVITPRLLDGDLNERRQAEHGQDIQEQREWLARNDAEALRVSMRAHAAAAKACEKERAAYDKLKAQLAQQEAEERAQAEKERAKAEALAEKERRKAEKEAAEKAAAEAKAEAKARKAAEEAAAREAKERAKAERIAAEKRAEEERIAAKERAKAEALAEKERRRAEKEAAEKAEAEARAEAKARKAAEEAAAREAKAREEAERKAEKERLKAEKRAAEERAEAERIAAKERAKAEKLAAKARAKAEKEAEAAAKAARAAAERAEAERLSAVRAAQEAREAAEAEARAREEAARLAAREREKAAEEAAAKAREEAEKARREAESLAAKQRAEAEKAAARERAEAERIAIRQRAAEEAAVLEAARRAEVEARARAAHEAFLAKQRAKADKEAAEAAARARAEEEAAAKAAAEAKELAKSAAKERRAAAKARKAAEEAAAAEARAFEEEADRRAEEEAAALRRFVDGERARAASAESRPEYRGE